MDTSLFGVLKNLLNINKEPRRNIKETESVLLYLKESSSIYQRILLFKSSFKRSIFALLE